MGIPEHDGRSLWETLMPEAFQAGLSWTTILRKREAFRKALRNFDPGWSRFDKKDVGRLLEDPGIVQSRPKIAATIAGARPYVAMQAAGGRFLVPGLGHRTREADSGHPVA